MWGFKKQNMNDCMFFQQLLSLKMKYTDLHYYIWKYLNKP